MIAVIDNDDTRAAGGLPCVVRWIGLQGLSVKAHTWCGTKHSAADGVGQVPDQTKICLKCDAAIVKTIEIAKLAGQTR